MERVVGRLCAIGISYTFKYLGNIELQKSTAIYISYINLIVNITWIVFTSLVLEAGIVILKDGDEERHQAGVTATAVSGVFLLLLILFIAFAIALIVGLHQDKASHVKAFRIYGTLMSLLLPIASVVHLVNELGDAIYFVLNLISFFWYIYFLTVMKNQYRRIKEATRKPTVEDTAANSLVFLLPDCNEESVPPHKGLSAQLSDDTVTAQ